MGLLSEYNLTDELTQDVLKELGFNESYAMSVIMKSLYDNVYIRLNFILEIHLNLIIRHFIVVTAIFLN